jgi:hypothetical protein
MSGNVPHDYLAYRQQLASCSMLHVFTRAMPPPTPTWQNFGDTTGTGNGALILPLNRKWCMASAGTHIHVWEKLKP